MGPHPPHHIQLCCTMARARKSKAEQGDFGPSPNADNWNSCLYKFLLFRTTKKKNYIPSLDSQDANERSVVEWIKEQHDAIKKIQVKNPDSARQLRSRKQQPITEDQIAVLKSVNFPFECNFWEEKFNALRAYKEKNGVCLVSQSHKELGHFVNNQRRLKKQIINGKSVGTLTAERIERLEKLGFVWEVRANPDDAFDNHLQELIDFQATNGHLKNRRLRKWLSKQRVAMKNGKLTKSRQEKLEASGINFQDTIEGDTAADGTNDLSEGIALLEAAGIDKQFTLEDIDDTAMNVGEGNELDEQQEDSNSGKEMEPQRKSEVYVASENKLHSK